MAMSTLGKDRFGLGPLYPRTDRRMTGEIPADTLVLRIWSQGRVCCVTAPETDSVCSGYIPRQRVPGESPCLPFRALGREAWPAGTPPAEAACLAWLHRVCKGSRDPGELAQAGTPSQRRAETPWKLLLYLLGPGFLRDTRLRGSAASGEIQGWLSSGIGSGTGSFWVAGQKENYISGQTGG